MVIRVIGVLLVVFLGGAVYFLSGAIIFAGKLEYQYSKEAVPLCDEWHRKYTYFDHQKPNGRQVNILRCEKAREIEVDSSYVTTKEGLQIHYVTLPNANKDMPIWLHVHGVTSSYLHGMRYLEAAERLGFNLVLMELQNHGRSERHPEGSSWGCREKWDIIAVITDLMDKYDQPILLSGTSMGTLAIKEALAGASSELLSAVKAVVFESPLQNVRTVFTNFFMDRGLGPDTSRLFFEVLLNLSKLRSSTDFASCEAKVTQENVVSMPTLMLLSAEEYVSEKRRESIKNDSSFSNVTLKLFDRGMHGSYWNYQPLEFEEAIALHWKKRNP